MKTFLYFALFAMAAISFSGCPAPPANTNANTNATNTNTNTASTAPTAEQLKALETKAFEAYKNKDGQYFQTFLTDNFTMNSDKGAKLDKAGTIKEVTENKCEISNIGLSDEKVTQVGPNAAVLTTTATAEGTCDGKPIPATTSSTLYVNVGGQWKAAYHGEVPKKGEGSETASNSNASNRMANAANKMTEAKENVNAKKEDVKANANAMATAKTPTPTPKPSATPASNSNTTASANTNSNSNSNANSTNGDLTTTLAFTEKSLWQAWKDKQSGPLEDALAPEYVFINMDGKVIATKADVIHEWTMPGCDVKSVSIDSPQTVQVTENVALLMFKGNASGTCNGTPLKPVLGTTIFRKEGVGWKPVYGISEEAAKS